MRPTQGRRLLGRSWCQRYGPRLTSNSRKAQRIGQFAHTLLAASHSGFQRADEVAFSEPFGFAEDDYVQITSGAGPHRARSNETSKPQTNPSLCRWSRTSLDPPAVGPAPSKWFAPQRRCRRLVVAGGMGGSESAEVGKAPVVGDRRDAGRGRVRFKQALVCSTQPHLTQVSHWRRAHVAPEVLL